MSQLARQALLFLPRPPSFIYHECFQVPTCSLVIYQHIQSNMKQPSCDTAEQSVHRLKPVQERDSAKPGAPKALSCGSPSGLHGEGMPKSWLLVGVRRGSDGPAHIVLFIMADLPLLILFCCGLCYYCLLFFICAGLLYYFLLAALSCPYGLGKGGEEESRLNTNK